MKEFNGLMEKKNLTPAEETKLKTYTDRRNEMHDFVDQSVKEMAKTLNDNKTKKTGILLDAARDAIKSTAQKRGYTIVLDAAAVVYSANDKTNDITEDAKKALDDHK